MLMFKSFWRTSRTLFAALGSGRYPFVSPSRHRAEIFWNRASPRISPAVPTIGLPVGLSVALAFSAFCRSLGSVAAVITLGTTEKSERA